MPLEAQAQEVLDQLSRYNAPPIETLTPQAARHVPLLDYAARDLVASQISARLLSLAVPTPEPVASVTHDVIPSPEGGLLARIYTPEGPGPHPVLLYFHGGGWVLANLDVYDASCRALCNAGRAIVVSVAYRQAPENRFPAAVDDASIAFDWVSRFAARFHGDPDRIAIAGESAGGNLAAVTCLLARERGVRPPVHQLLIYPVTDFEFDKPSFREHSVARPLNTPMMGWFRQFYLRGESDILDYRASPLRAPHHRNLPPATVITAEYDPLRDDGRLYASRLQDSGVDTTWHHYTGVMHEFFGLANLLDDGRKALDTAAAALKNAFGTA